MTAALVLGLLGAASCAAPEEAAPGSVSMDLVGQAPSGAVYRLRQATITVSGEGSTRVWNTEDAPDRTTLTDDVPAGSYTATVAPGWELERIEGTRVTRVIAELTSDNPASFTVLPRQRTVVPLRFHVGTEDVETGQGYEIVVGVEESPAQLIIVTSLGDDDDASIAVFPIGSRGDVAPLRRITGPLTTLEFPAGVTVAGDEIIVCDADAGAIDFFPLLGNGNIAPSRRIAGYDTEIDSCFGVAVFDGELYVARFDEVLVFPLTASGEVPPSRRISGFSGAQFFAIDQGELYVTDEGADSVFVFPLPVADGAVPTRVVSARCPTGVVAGNGELVVASGCRDRINVYPEAASGDVPPLRTIFDLDNPQQIARRQGLLYVADASSDQVLVFRDTADDQPPSFSIGGPLTGVFVPIGITVH